MGFIQNRCSGPVAAKRKTKRQAGSGSWFFEFWNENPCFTASRRPLRGKSGRADQEWKMSQDPSHSSHTAHEHQQAGPIGVAESAHGHAHAGHKQGAASAQSKGTIGAAAMGGNGRAPCTRRSCVIRRAIAPSAAWRWCRSQAQAARADDAEERDLARRLRVGIVLSIPLVVLAMAPMVGIHEPLDCSRVHAAGSSSCWARRSCCGPAGRFCANSGSRSCIARSTCTR